ncbi:MAG TPA: hypothetical protein VFE05_21105 [Longimicrobiaceae bacterium]|jgi:hypothetical protein|nr:hypothetical protein [Longimicrobiaceae bacterium]
MERLKLTAEELIVDSFATQIPGGDPSDTGLAVMITNPTAMTYCRICPEYPYPE